MRNCADFRAQMVAYVRGELLPLERAHIESHVGRCRSCAVLEKKCARAFEAVGAHAPAKSIDAQHLDRLKRRLRPYVADARPVRPSLLPIGGLAFAGAAAIALLIVLLPGSPAVVSPVIATAPEVVTEDRVDVAHQAIAEAAPFAPVEAVLHRAIGEHLHVIAGRGWDGHVSKHEPEDMRLEMQKGYAVMAFRGGEGRKLTVVAPNVEVEVIGTKFFVNVLANGTTAVGVVSGRVRVNHSGGSELVDAGSARAYGEGQAAPVPAPAAATPAIDLDDAFIADHGHEEHASVVEVPAVPKDRPVIKVEKRPVVVAPAVVSPEPKPEVAAAEPVIEPEPEAEPEAEAEPEPKQPTVAEVIAHAERLVAAGDIDGALHVYEGALAGEDQAIVAHRSLFRYELARLLGFEKKEVARARDIFERLTITAGGEVRTQAAFALCELDLAGDPCSAAACLRAIVRDSSSTQNVIREANGLITRWKLADCDHK